MKTPNVSCPSTGVSIYSLFFSNALLIFSPAIRNEIHYLIKGLCLIHVFQYSQVLAPTHYGGNYFYMSQIIIRKVSLLGIKIKVTNNGRNLCKGEIA